MSKRIKQTFTSNSTGGENLTLTCKVCGEQIIKSTQFGMYCKNECGLEEDKEVYNNLINLLSGFLSKIEEK